MGAEPPDNMEADFQKGAFQETCSSSLARIMLSVTKPTVRVGTKQGHEHQEISFPGATSVTVYHLGARVF